MTGPSPLSTTCARIGADPATDVRLVVASHWHDDHVAGIAEVVQACETATFVSSPALTREECLALILENDHGEDLRSGTREFASVVNTLDVRKATGGLASTRAWAGPAKRLWVRFDDPVAEVWTLTPSDEAVSRTLTDLAALLTDHRTGVRRRVRPVRPNHASVVVWVRVAEHTMLFGGDLEVHTDPRLGWQAVLSTAGRPRDRAALYKVAHHGSPNGDSSAIWTDLLTSEPVACLTPFTRGRTPRPQAEDIQQICGRVAQLYVTAPARGPAAARRAAPVERSIREVVGETLRPAEPDLGAVRCYPDDDEPSGWSAELFGPAFAACHPLGTRV